MILSHPQRTMLSQLLAVLDHIHKTMFSPTENLDEALPATKCRDKTPQGTGNPGETLPEQQKLNSDIFLDAVKANSFKICTVT